MSSIDHIRMLIEVGMHPTIPLALLDAFGGHAFDGPKLSTEDKLFLCGPVVVHSRDRNPQDHPVHTLHRALAAIYTDRFDTVFKRSKLPIGPVEIAMVMFEQTLEAPLTREATEIYVWACCETMKRLRGTPDEPVLDKMLERQPGIKLNGHLIMSMHPYRENYLRLCAEIRRKVVSESRTKAIKAVKEMEAAGL